VDKEGYVYPIRIGARSELTSSQLITAAPLTPAPVPVCISDDPAAASGAGVELAEGET
jgi:hypothetical protein